MSNLRTVKKYSNRRLYDLEVKRHVTLDDVYEWVVDGTDVRVIDQDSQEDVTCSVLLQVVATLEKRLDPSLSIGFLQQAIRDSAEDSDEMMALFLDLSLRLFLSGELKHLARTAPREDPTAAPARLAAETYRRWCSARPEICRTLANATSDHSPPERATRSPQQPRSDPDRPMVK